jgi:hypothetical protein
MFLTLGCNQKGLEDLRDSKRQVRDLDSCPASVSHNWVILGIFAKLSELAFLKVNY